MGGWVGGWVGGVHAGGPARAGVEGAPCADAPCLLCLPAADEFKDNCNLVIADFLIRHGCLTPDMRGYLQLLRGLRQGDCS